MTRLITRLSVLCFILACSLSAQASNDKITGEWQTIDDETKEPKSNVFITIKDNILTGTVTKLYIDPEKNQDPTCKDCKGENKDKKVIGLEIISGMQADGDRWEDGEILDPGNGKLYDCKIWLEGDKLKVRGYIGFFYRTQTWVRPS